MNLNSMEFNAMYFFFSMFFYREFQENGVGLNAAQFKQLLISALKDLFGEVWNHLVNWTIPKIFVINTERTLF